MGCPCGKCSCVVARRCGGWQAGRQPSPPPQIRTCTEQPAGRRTCVHVGQHAICCEGPQAQLRQLGSCQFLPGAGGGGRKRCMRGQHRSVGRSASQPAAGSPPAPLDLLAPHLVTKEQTFDARTQSRTLKSLASAVQAHAADGGAGQGLCCSTDAGLGGGVLLRTRPRRPCPCWAPPAAAASLASTAAPLMFAPDACEPGCAAWPCMKGGRGAPVRVSWICRHADVCTSPHTCSHQHSTRYTYRWAYGTPGAASCQARWAAL